MLVQLLPHDPVLLVTVLRIVIGTWLTRVTRVLGVLQLQFPALDVYARLAARLALDDLVHCAWTTELSSMRTAAEDGVASPVHVQHVVKLIEVGVLRHLPLSIRVWDVNSASFHLLIELVLVIAGRTFEGSFAGL